MSTKKPQTRAIVPKGRSAPPEEPEKMTVGALIRRLPTAVLVPGVILVFAALVADLVVADPLPVIDEAALLWGLGQSLRVLSERRRATRAAETELDDDIDVVADVLPENVEVVGAR